MCRSIKPLFNYEPPVTDEEIREASLQFVRKITGMTSPSQKNSTAYQNAVTEISGIVDQLLQTLKTSAPAKNRANENAKKMQKYQN